MTEVETYEPTNTRTDLPNGRRLPGRAEFGALGWYDVRRSESAAEIRGLLDQLDPRTRGTITPSALYAKDSDEVWWVMMKHGDAEAVKLYRLREPKEGAG